MVAKGHLKHAEKPMTGGWRDQHLEMRLGLGGVEFLQQHQQKEGVVVAFGVQ